eukprot:1552470-Rhodomonas_salina.1
MLWEGLVQLKGGSLTSVEVGEDDDSSLARDLPLKSTSDGRQKSTSDTESDLGPRHELEAAMARREGSKQART